MVDHPIRRLSGYAPIIMSLIGMALIVEAVFAFGPDRPKDEEWQAHIFQLLMVLQIPFIFGFAFTGWRSFNRILPVFAAQLALWFGAWSLVAYFHL